MPSVSTTSQRRSRGGKTRTVWEEGDDDNTTVFHCCNDFLRLTSVTLDHLTITAGMPFYMRQLVKWPDYSMVALAPGNRMMGYQMAVQIFVSPFLGVVYANLSSLILDEIGVVLGVNKELEKLSNTLSIIRDVLEDAEIKQIDDKPINNWLRKLKDLTYKADDIVDECAIEALLPESDIVRNSSCNIQVLSPTDSSSCFNFKRIMFRRSIGNKIKKLLEKFDEMAELRTKFHLNLIPKHVESGRNELRETSSFLTEPQVYGREKEKEDIANLLLKGGNEVSVFCIVGMGGLGKTTLAQLVYNDEKIKEHFQLRCWVCVSEDFVLKTLLKSIIESTGGNAQDLKDLDPLQRRVEEILSGKKFLLVLDDVWNEDQTKWDKLKSVLTCGGEGSSIIVTTRLQTVASITSKLPIFCLETLSEGDCWCLFKHYAFDTENENDHPMLEKIGKEIVKKCGGVPLAAKALGGLLRFEKTENGWLHVRDSALWDLPQDKEDAILPALRLSYNHLSSPLKQCFSYCSIFPKDYRMKKRDLIHLWMANGFVQPKGSMGLEDTGNVIFNELLWRSFFQEEEHGYGGIVDCKMHDLVHDLACSITLNECTYLDCNKENSFSMPSLRHLSLYSKSSYLVDIIKVRLLKSQPQLRTFFQLNRMMRYEQAIQGLTFSNLKCLRVLDLHNTDINTLHVSISNLKHLRYLDLSRCRNLKSLPDASICKLRNLQVLKLDDCRSLEVLPSNIRNLTNLRHLGIDGCYKLRIMPVGIGNLRCLRTLRMFIVAPKNGCGISELEGLDHLTGELEIKGLQHVKNLNDARNANLLRKKLLHELRLFWSEESNGNMEVSEEEATRIGEELQPHSNIKKLHLEYYNGLNFPNWLSQSCLPNLIEISLVNCGKCEHLPSLGRLAFLKILTISGMDSVKCIGEEFYGDQGSFFPTLKELHISRMPNLEEWNAPPLSSKEEENTNGRTRGEEELPVFPFLEELIFKGCPKLRTLPTILLSAVKYLRLQELEELQNCHKMILECVRSWDSCLPKFVISLCDKIETFPKMLLENLPTTLTHLDIYDSKELVCLPAGFMQNLTSLKSITIRHCDRLKYLPELGSKNTALTSLSIENCDGLTSVSDCLRHLTTLEDLTITSCPMLEFLQNDFQDLKSLQLLTLKEVPQMTYLPEGLQQGSGTLENLDIICCSGLTSLPEWMDKFTSLRRLYIRDCENLKVLPEEVLHLTSLEDLKILDCHPDLHGRYTKETGKDWHKIAHIPHLDMHQQYKISIDISCFFSSSGTN